ncbi:hypothetical protein I5E68_14800 [Novosphingobium sp. YJ-S2-02]|uniref:Uncharacterized protein n=1 Tax=Novosphingobium aureum TaxID=2792964 RepID=A0A931HDX3_9SPHN|nr:hypothetical protein [Novosphingobium aureum]MBH0114211.1 hypothetical protein [Novosphingobium aureum]
MQTVAQTVEIVSYVTATPANRVSQLARNLITAGILPKSSGRDVKKVDGGALIGLLGAVAYSDNIAAASGIAAALMNLPLRIDGEAGEATLASVFAQSIAYDDWEGAELELSSVASGYTATIRGQIVMGTLALTGEFPFWKVKSQGGWVKRSFVIDRSGIEILRNLFRREDLNGMEFK